MATKGKFIVFEGTDGSGKTTQMKLLKEYLEEKGVPCRLTHEPTQSPIGELLKSCMAGAIQADEYTIAALFAADRLNHVFHPEEGIAAALDEGITVLCDRYYFSSLAYNGGFVPLDWVQELNRPAMEQLSPDLVVFLDLTAEESMERVNRRKNRERYETPERQQKIRENYIKIFENSKYRERVAVIRSEAEKQATQQNVRRAVDRLFGF